MNKVVTINLNGNAYQLEEGAYDRLRDYLEGAARKLAGNPDRDEIVADIEQSIADKCRAALGAYRTVVSLPMIETILSEMGPVEDGSTAAAPGGADAGSGAAAPGAASAKPAAEESGAEPYRRLYRVREGAMVGGVCNGLAAYFGIDPTLVRLLFVLLALVTLGAAAAIYIVMMIVIPAARTPAENAAAFGTPSTAQEFIRRARAGYYEGMRTFHDKEAHRAWKRRFKEEMREMRRHLRMELRAGRFRWQQHWAYGPGATPPPGAFFVWPLFGLIRAALTIAFLACILSLVFTGAIFGLILPWGMPFWVGIILLVVVFNLLVWPFRLHRWGVYHDGPHGVFWLAILVLGIWLADKHVPHFHEALMEIPPVLHRMAEDLRAWWTRH